MAETLMDRIVQEATGNDEVLSLFCMTGAYEFRANYSYTGRYEYRKNDDDDMMMWRVASY